MESEHAKTRGPGTLDSRLAPIARVLWEARKAPFALTFPPLVLVLMVRFDPDIIEATTVAGLIVATLGVLFALVGILDTMSQFGAQPLSTRAQAWLSRLWSAVRKPRMGSTHITLGTGGVTVSA